MKNRIFRKITVFVISLNLILIFFNSFHDKTAPAAYINGNINKTVILDAGHGGEDGGTKGFDGTLEKNINLCIADKISVYFDIFGIDYIMTRNSDEALGDKSLDTIRKRKASDIKTRYNIVNSKENSCLLSIHQNYFPVEKYHGTQVFYSASSAGSDKWAENIQNSVSLYLQSDNNRKIKPSGKNIFLLYNAVRPSVMVECGFLSNKDELNKLKDSSYQSQLAYFICKGTIQYLNQ